MRNYWLTEYFLAAIGWGYISVTVAAVALALWLPKSRRAKGLWTAAVLALASILPIQGCEQYLQERQAGKVREARYRVARDLFEERCKQAGEKIYRTVEGVEGITLLNLRTGNQREEYDPIWSGAGLPLDATGEGYISNFLLWEHKSSTSTRRGFLNSLPENAFSSGYAYVDVLQADKKFLRYRINPTRGQGKDFMVVTPTDGPPARYAVRYEDVSAPNDREYWVAGARVTVLDLKTNEILAELTAFSFEQGQGSRSGFRQPWRRAVTCPEFSRGSSIDASRYFVDQIVKPIQGK